MAEPVPLRVSVAVWDGVRDCVGVSVDDCVCEGVDVGVLDWLFVCVGD